MSHDWDTVAIIGVGLIGGSIGLALGRRGLARQVIGIGRDASRLQAARDRAAVTSFTCDVSEGVRDAELVVVCTPVDRIVADIRAAAEACPPGALLTDAGSTKGLICRELAQRLGPGGIFIGSHPMAGSEKSGVSHARAELFDDRLTIVTPLGHEPGEHVNRIERFWNSLGSRTIRMEPETHDAAVAAISHLPHLIASALSAATPPESLPLAAGGWRDTTRVASGDAGLWRQILLENRAYVLRSLDNFGKVLEGFRQALNAEDPQRLEQLLEAGKRNRDSLGS